MLFPRYETIANHHFWLSLVGRYILFCVSSLKILPPLTKRDKIRTDAVFSWFWIHLSQLMTSQICRHRFFFVTDLSSRLMTSQTLRHILFVTFCLSHFVRHRYVVTYLSSVEYKKAFKGESLRSARRQSYKRNIVLKRMKKFHIPII